MLCIILPCILFKWWDLYTFQFSEVSQQLQNTCSSLAQLSINENAGIEPVDPTKIKQQAARYVRILLHVNWIYGFEKFIRLLVKEKFPSGGGLCSRATINS